LILVRAVDADADDLHEHAAAVVDVGDLRRIHLAKVHRVRCAWVDGERLHRVEPPEA
jgi:hypothetical protein